MTTWLTLVSSKKKPSPLAQAVEDYIAARRAQGLSPETLKYAMRWPHCEIFLRRRAGK